MAQPLQCQLQLLAGTGLFGSGGRNQTLAVQQHGGFHGIPPESLLSQASGGFRAGFSKLARQLPQGSPALIGGLALQFAPGQWGRRRPRRAESAQSGDRLGMGKPGLRSKACRNKVARCRSAEFQDPPDPLDRLHHFPRPAGRAA